MLRFSGGLSSIFVSIYSEAHDSISWRFNISVVGSRAI